MTTLTITIDTDKWAVVPRVPNDKLRSVLLEWCSTVECAWFDILAAAAAPRPVPAEDQVLVNRDTVLWLLGENGDFVCPPDQYFRGKPTPYFWRKALREAATGLQRPENP